MIIPKGKVVNFTDGAYSDYCLRWTVRALKDLDTAALVHEFASTLGDKVDVEYGYKTKEIVGYRAKGYSFRPSDEFMLWLSKQGYVEEFDDVQEWWVGETYDLHVSK